MDQERRSTVPRWATAVTLLLTVVVPGLLSLAVLFIGLATYSGPLILVALIVACFSAYGWIRRDRSSSNARTEHVV